MRKITVLAGILGALAIIVVVGAGGSVASNAKHQRLSVVAQDSEATFTPSDFGQAFAPNQQATETAPVYRDGVEVGRAETVITVTRVEGEDVTGIIECSVELPEGNVFFNGSFHFADMAAGAAVPVVGGTGDYAGFTGVVTMTASADGTATTLAFDVRKP